MSYGRRNRILAKHFPKIWMPLVVLGGTMNSLVLYLFPDACLWSVCPPEYVTKMGMPLAMIGLTVNSLAMCSFPGVFLCAVCPPVKIHRPRNKMMSNTTWPTRQRRRTKFWSWISPLDGNGSSEQTVSIEDTSTRQHIDDQQHTEYVRWNYGWQWL